MEAVNPADLPYPRQPAVLTPTGPKPIPAGALDAGTAQCLDLSTQEAEGVLSFFGTWLGFEPDAPSRPEPYQWPYAKLEGFSLKRGLMLRLVKAVKHAEMLTLILWFDGRRLRFRTGSMLAGNAAYILISYGVPSR